MLLSTWKSKFRYNNLLENFWFKSLINLKIFFEVQSLFEQYFYLKNLTKYF